MSLPNDRSLRATDGPWAQSHPLRTWSGRESELPRVPSQPRTAPAAAEAPDAMFSQQQQQLQQLQQQQLQQQQLQQQLQQQQQLLQLQQLLQQSPPQAPLAVAVSRGLPQQQPQQQLLNLQGTSSASLLNGPVLQRALLLQQLQGLDQFAMPPATYDSTGLTIPTATLGSLRGYSLVTPSLAAPSLTPPQLAPANLQQFFPQATRQSLLGPPPVGVPMNPSQLSLSGRTPQKQARTSSGTPNRKDSSSQTTPVEDGADPPEGSEEATEPRTDTADRGSPSCPDGIAKENHAPAPEPASCEESEPPAKRSKSSAEPTEKGPPGPLQSRITAPKQTQTPELLPEPPGARVVPRFQPRVLQIQAPVQTQTRPQRPPADTQVQPKVQKQAQTQTIPEHLVPRQLQLQKEEAEPLKQVQPPLKRWCPTCQVYYMGDLIQHRRTQDHKIAKQSLRPFCTVCNRYFKTPRKFVEHVKSQGHKDKAKELKTLEKEVAGQDEDHFITVDAVGCFEGDEEEEEEDEEEIDVDEEFCKQMKSKDISVEEWKGSETYSPNTAYGMDFLVPVVGHVCRICHKLCQSNSEAQLAHCKSLAHFENLQKYKKAKNPSPTTRPVSRRSAITARNALTALFTSNGRPHVYPSIQDTAKPPSKVTPQPPQPPPPRRSTRLKT
uniref:CDKN1A interacting zinc finger protein 1 n=1 Tax=Rousettus aegyptiacus TaxID=9407 RepID=A0A7J8IHR6_ROUAE|nr:CDKN1A interacting zinc finger protein 1 [Rousettus aegyptiacus]